MWWNIRPLQDKLGLWTSAPRFDNIKGDGSTRKLSSWFDERALVCTSLSQAQLHDDSDDTRALGSYSFM